MVGFSKKDKDDQNGDSKKPVSKVKSWYQDRYQMVVMQRNVMFLIMLASLFVAGLSTVAVATLNDSKVFEPYLIQVEDKTGIVTQVSNQKIEKYTADEAVIKSLIYKYINARESYSATNYEHNYYKVARLLSTSSIHRRFLSDIDITKPQSPLNLKGAELEVGMKSMGPISAKEPDRWQVRFTVRQRSATSGGLSKTSHYIVTLKYGFDTSNLSMKDRYINPLGFQIQEYRKDIDADV